MKKFFTVIPLQEVQKKPKLDRYRYTAVGNQNLQIEDEISFPILAAIGGYLQPGEESAVIAVITEDTDAVLRYAEFCEQLKEICGRRNLIVPKIHEVYIPNDEQVSTHAQNFQKLIKYAEDNDELFCCMTFGSKPLSKTLLMAIQYAYRIKNNTSIGAVVYGQVDWNKEPKEASVYDETALLQLDELVQTLAQQGVQNPETIIGMVLSL